jgi:hypothetical protein
MFKKLKHNRVFVHQIKVRFISDVFTVRCFPFLFRYTFGDYIALKE